MKTKKLLTITRENYFSEEAQNQYMGATQFKAFMACEAAALAELRGAYKRPVTPALLIGSYVDAYFEGRAEEFKNEHPELFTKQGELKAEYKRAEYIIRRVTRDELFMRYMSGEKQAIRTGTIEGVPVKIKMDSYHEGRAIVDMKIMKDFGAIYSPELGRQTFVEAWGYDIQGAIYQSIEGNGLPFYIAGATKETEPDIAIIHVPQHYITSAMEIVRGNIHRFYALKNGESEPIRCEHCDYCKQTKVLDRVISLEELDGAA